MPAAEKKTLEVYVARSFWDGERFVQPGETVSLPYGLAADVIHGRKGFLTSNTVEVENAKREVAVWHSRFGTKEKATSKAREGAEHATR